MPSIIAALLVRLDQAKGTDIIAEAYRGFQAAEAVIVAGSKGPSADTRCARRAREEARLRQIPRPPGRRTGTALIALGKAKELHMADAECHRELVQADDRKVSPTLLQTVYVLLSEPGALRRLRARAVQPFICG